MKWLLVLFISLLSLTVVEQTLGGNQADHEASEYGRALLRQINLYRAEYGAAPLQFDPLLIRLAKGHSTEMSRQQMMGHERFNERFAEAKSRFCVENVGWNYPAPRAMFDGWRRSSHHNENMLQSGIRRVGIAEVDKYVTYFACR